MTEIEGMFHIFRNSLSCVVLNRVEFLKKKKGFRSGMIIMHFLVSCVSAEVEEFVCFQPAQRRARLSVPEWHREETTGSFIALISLSGFN